MRRLCSRWGSLLRAFTRLVVVLLVLGGAEPVGAYVDNLRVAPEHPIAGRPVTLTARAGECHSFTSGGGRRLERNGNHLRAIAEGASAVSDACIAPEQQFQFEIGALDAGSYEVTLVLEDLYFLEQTIEFGTVQFTVGNASTIPAQSTSSQAVLLMALCLGAAHLLRQKVSQERAHAAGW